MKIFILTASPFYGGPERQMLELLKTFRQRHPDINGMIGSFSEKGSCRPFLEKVAEAGFETIELTSDFPRLIRAKNELHKLLVDHKIDILITNGHKARGVSCLLPKSLGIPIITVSRGWTTENFKIKLFSFVDRMFHRRADHVIAVSDGQAAKAIRYGTPLDRISVIRNAIRTDRFDQNPDPSYREKLLAMFPDRAPGTLAQPATTDISDSLNAAVASAENIQAKPTFLLGAAGRLSPEKGFDLLIEAVKQVRDRSFSVGLVLFGEGFLREQIEKQIELLGLQNFAILPGFTNELDHYLPHFDIFVQSSHTEGLPNVLLESMAARTPVVATCVGGTSEVVDEGLTGLMVPPGDATKLADAICQLLSKPDQLPVMGAAARERVQTHFTFENQADRYAELLGRFFKK